MTRRELTASPTVRRLLVSRWPQFTLSTLLLAGFGLAIVAGFFGTPVGSRNLAIVAVWISWWALLILVAVPLLGRAWCSVCPIPAPGEWLQRGGIMGPGTRAHGLARRWPRRLRNMWLQNAAFGLLAVFSVVILTQPLVTALVLLGLLVAATALALMFERRAFCRYVCPVGGFIGLYSQAAPVELRVRDKSICAAHRTKECFTGNAAGRGCPWMVYPGALRQNTYCGLCLECLRSCPYDNVVVNWRPAGADLTAHSRSRVDEAYKALIMLGSAIVYAAVMLGPWSGIKTAAFHVGSGPWFAYAAAFLTFVFLALPGALLGAVTLARVGSRGSLTLRADFARFASTLIPLGLAAWIAFTVSFVFANGSYVAPLLSDPFGLGWNLLGTARVAWRPVLTAAAPPMQAAIVIGGLAWTGSLVKRVARDGGEARGASALPVLSFCLAVAVALLWLFVG